MKVRVILLLSLMSIPSVSFATKYTGQEACSLLQVFLKMNSRIQVDCNYINIKEMRGSTYFIKILSTPFDGAKTVGSIIGAIESVDRKVPTKTAGVLLFNNKVKMVFSMPVDRKCLKMPGDIKKGMCLMMAATPID